MWLYMHLVLSLVLILGIYNLIQIYLIKFYLIIEDGNTFCIKASTMHEAVNICEQSYLEEYEEEDHEYERKFYNESILQSCYLVGELRN